MQSIKLKLKDGTEKRFEHRGRAGGSYTIRAEFTDGWVHIVDEYDHRESYPSVDVVAVEQKEFSRW